MKKAIRLLASPRLSLLLIIIILVFLYMGTTNLFEDPSRQKLLSSRIFYTPVFLLVASVFFLNLAVCTYRQIRFLFQQSNPKNFTVEVWTSPVISRYEEGQLIAGTKEILKSAGFKISTEYNGSLYAYKGRIGSWGSPVLHLGLLIILVGAFIQLTFDFTGFFGMPEGSTFTDTYEEYSVVREGIYKSRDYRRFELFLHKVNITSKKNGAQAEGFLYLIKDGEIVRKQWVGQGHPLSYGLTNFYFNRVGYFVNIKFLDRQGKTENYLVRLDTNKHASSEDYKGNLTIPSTGYNVSIDFIPALPGGSGTGQGIPRTISYEPRNPAGYIVVNKGGDDRNRQVLFSGIVPLGEQVVLASGEKLAIDSILPWITLYAKNEPGIYVVYAGLLVTIIGVSILYCVVHEAKLIKTEPCIDGFRLIIKGKRSKINAITKKDQHFIDRINDLLSHKD